MRPLSISPAVRILLVDDHQLVVEGVAAMLRRAARCDVLCSPPDVHPSDSVRTMLPKVVVMELALRRWGSLDELMGAVREICAHASVVVFSRHSDETLVQRLFDAGSSAYVLKRSSVEELLRAIHAAAGGHRYLDSSLRDRLAQRFLQQHSPGRMSVSRLSDREDTVLRELAWGYSIKDIATDLGVSIKTIEVHRASGMRKLGVRNRRELMQHALREQWLMDECAPLYRRRRA
jgi:two-component system response regulator NreC